MSTLTKNVGGGCGWAGDPCATPRLPCSGGPVSVCLNKSNDFENPEPDPFNFQNVLGLNNQSNLMTLIF